MKLYLLIFLLLTTTSCMPAAVATLDAVGRATNASSLVAVEAYRVQLDEASRRGATREEALAAVHAVEVRWRVYWSALDALSAAQDAAKAALKSGDSGDVLGTVRQALCGVLGVLGAVAPAAGGRFADELGRIAPLGELACHG